MSEHMRLLGKFSIGKQDIETDPDVVMKVMTGVIVLRCEFMYHRAEFDYLAIHPDFDLVPDMEEPPEYDCNIKEDGTVEWQKKA